MGVMLIKLGLVIPGNGDGFDDDKNKDGFVGGFEGGDTHQMVMVLVVLVMTGLEVVIVPSCQVPVLSDQLLMSIRHLMSHQSPGGVSSTTILVDCPTQLTLIFMILIFVFVSFMTNMFHDKYQICKYEKTQQGNLLGCGRQHFRLSICFDFY